MLLFSDERAQPLEDGIDMTDGGGEVLRILPSIRNLRSTHISGAAADGFSGARVRALVESEGFKLEPDGVFHLQDGNENTLLTIANQEAVPFLPEAVSGMITPGITLLLDVPRVADAEVALQRMFELGRSLSVTLKGRLVDDNRATLTSASMDKIRRQLKDIHVTMNTQGIAPGSARALRLFS